MTTVYHAKARRALTEVLRRGYRVTPEGHIIGVKGHTLKLSLNLGGYAQFAVRFENTMYSIRVHRLVAYCKYGDALFDAECVRHLDGDQRNNSWGNIAIGTHSENATDISPEVRRRRGLAGGKITGALTRKLTADQVRSIRHWYGRVDPATGKKFTQTHLGKIYGVDQSRVSDIISRKKYADVK